MKWIPKKYMQHIDEVYKDDDGWWAYTKKGFTFEGMDCHTAHENSQKDLLAMIRTIKPCECDECKECPKTINNDLTNQLLTNLKTEHDRLEAFVKEYSGKKPMQYEIDRLRELKSMIKKLCP